MLMVILWAGSLASPAAAKSVRSSERCPPNQCPPLPPDGDGDGDKPSKGEPKKATFKLSLHGEQAFATSGDYVHEAEPYPGDYSYTCHNETSEDVSFATPQPLKVTVTRRRYSGHPRDYILWFAFGPGGPLQGLGFEESGWGDPTLEVEADVERHVVHTGPEVCFFHTVYGPEDCTRSGQGLDWWLALTGRPGLNPNAGGIELFDDPTRDQPDPFPDCPGALFPDMALSLDPWGSLLKSGAQVSPGKLFNPQVKRITISPSELKEDSSATYTERLSYTVSLKRVAKK
jgi:hypothetical protein